jgi:hypothetical protein
MAVCGISAVKVSTSTNHLLCQMLEAAMLQVSGCTVHLVLEALKKMKCDTGMMTCDTGVMQSDTGVSTRYAGSTFV